jgi:hypothetical protein
MQHYHFSRVDQVGIDQMGVDQVGINQMGVDQVGINQMYSQKKPQQLRLYKC